MPSLALLIGCGLRRGQLLALKIDSVQLREEHWVIADLHGNAGHIRTVPIPLWVKVSWPLTTCGAHVRVCVI
jgi:integrase